MVDFDKTNDADSQLTLDNEKLQFAILEMYDELLRFIQGKIPNWLADSFGAEDLLQETLIVAFKRIDQFRGSSEKTLFVWLRTIAENKLRDLIRAQRRNKRGGNARRVRISAGSQTSSFFKLIEILSARDPSPSRKMAENEATRAMKLAIAALPEDQRRAIHLRHIAGNSLAETAAQMNKSPGAVRGLLQRGKANLKESLDHSARWFSK